MIPYQLNPRGYVIRAKDRQPLLGHNLVRELNKLDSQVVALRRELASSVGGLTPDPEALRDLEESQDDDRPVAAVAATSGADRPAKTTRSKK